jgi:hypothetical protein
MNKVKHQVSFTNLMVVLLLLASIVCSNFNFSEHFAGNHQTIVTKKSENSAASYAQLLCEEKEKEEEGISRHSSTSNLVLIYQICDLFSTSSPQIQLPCQYNSPSHCGETTNVPVYLAKRTFLI